MSYSGRFRDEANYPTSGGFVGREAARASEAGGADLRELFAVLYRHRKFILAVTAGVLALASLYLLTAGTAYTATVSILVDARTRPPVGTDQPAGQMTIPDATLVESQVKLIASDTVLRRVAQSERLAEDPEYVSTKPGLRMRLFALLGMGSGATGGEDRVTRATMSLARSIAVKRSERTYVIDVDLASSDPNKSARLANMVAEAYIADQREARSQISRQDSQWLNQRLNELQAKLQDAENRAQEFKVKNRITDAVGKNMREQELSDLTAELGRARARAIDMSAKYEQVRKLAASGRPPDGTMEALKAPVLEKLRVQYSEIARQEAHYRTTLGDRHPAMLEVQSQLRDSTRLIAGELRRIAESAGNEYQQARAAELETLRRVESARQSTESKNQNSVKLRELERELDAHRNAYEKFLRVRETMNDEATDGPIARVIAPATAPLVPSSPKSLAILFISLASGLFFGVGSALLREYIGSGGSNAAREAGRGAMDDGGVKLHVIASLPRVGGVSAKARSLTRWMASKANSETEVPVDNILNEVRDRPDSEFSAAVRGLFKSIAPSEDAPARRATAVLAISMREKCGKTTLAVNLAQAASAAGLRALLIDANSDHPSLGALLGSDARPQLIELSGAQRPLYRIGGAGRGELSVVPILQAEAKNRRDLSRAADTIRLKGINGNFDFVVIDGPALASGGDLRLVAGAANHILFVAGPDESSPSIDELIDALDVPQRKLAGTIVSMSQARRAA